MTNTPMSSPSAASPLPVTANIQSSPLEAHSHATPPPSMTVQHKDDHSDKFAALQFVASALSAMPSASPNGFHGNQNNAQTHSRVHPPTGFYSNTHTRLSPDPSVSTSTSPSPASLMESTRMGTAAETSGGLLIKNAPAEHHTAHGPHDEFEYRRERDGEMEWEREMEGRRERDREWEVDRGRSYKRSKGYQRDGDDSHDDSHFDRKRHRSEREDTPSRRYFAEPIKRSAERHVASSDAPAPRVAGTVYACETCGITHSGAYGSGRFCSVACKCRRNSLRRKQFIQKTAEHTNGGGAAHPNGKPNSNASGHPQTRADCERGGVGGNFDVAAKDAAAVVDDISAASVPPKKRHRVESKGTPSPLSPLTDESAVLDFVNSEGLQHGIVPLSQVIPSESLAPIRADEIDRRNPTVDGVECDPKLFVLWMAEGREKWLRKIEVTSSSSDTSRSGFVCICCFLRFRLDRSSFTYISPLVSGSLSTNVGSLNRHQSGSIHRQSIDAAIRAMERASDPAAGDSPPLTLHCATCGVLHDGKYANGRFCSAMCGRRYSNASRNGRAFDQREIVPNANGTLNEAKEKMAKSRSERKEKEASLRSHSPPSRITSPRVSPRVSGAQSHRSLREADHSTHSHSFALAPLGHSRHSHSRAVVAMPTDFMRSFCEFHSRVDTAALPTLLVKESELYADFTPKHLAAFATAHPAVPVVLHQSDTIWRLLEKWGVEARFDALIAKRANDIVQDTMMDEVASRRAEEH